MDRVKVSRRGFVAAGLGLGLGRLAFAAETGGEADLVKGIDRTVVWNGRAGGTTWFHPRACMVPGSSPPLGLMTLQSIGGSDYFGHVHWSITKDLGRTWSEPKPIPSLGRHPAKDDLQEGVCDVVPDYHAKTNTVLAIGHNVYYRKGHLARPQLERYPMYVVRSADGTWSEARRIEWDDPRTTAIYTCGCAQRVTLDNGDLLIPLSFAPKGQTDRGVGTVLCGFDGRTVSIKKHGNELRNGVKRGLLEPNLVRFKGRFYMTIRSEDGRGYVTVTDDGFEWAKQQAWRWDDGEPLTMSTTQQHWLVHSETLSLVYTRKAAKNVNVMRWRAPLYMAAVDLDKLCLTRATERVVLPLIGDGVNNAKHVARMGNFHTTAATPSESWVTVGECLPDDGWRGDLLMARVHWTRPNRLT